MVHCNGLRFKTLPAYEEFEGKLLENEDACREINVTESCGNAFVERFCSFVYIKECCVTIFLTLVTWIVSI
jgi:hypothetical protein